MTIEEVAQATDVHRTTLSKIANTVGYSTTTDILDALCNYFDCEIEDMAEHIKDGVKWVSCNALLVFDKTL